jgi:hypothetical protein
MSYSSQFFHEKTKIDFRISKNYFTNQIVINNKKERKWNNKKLVLVSTKFVKILHSVFMKTYGEQFYMNYVSKRPQYCT